MTEQNSNIENNQDSEATPLPRKTHLVILSIYLAIASYLFYAPILIFRLRHETGFIFGACGFILAMIAELLGDRIVHGIKKKKFAPISRRLSIFTRVFLVVTLLIGLLVLPNSLEFFCQQDVARQGICRKHLKEISVALLAYAEEHNEHFPDADHWTDNILPYLKDPKVLHCPSDSSDAKCSYAMNAMLSGIELGDIVSPAQTALVFDSSKTGDSPSGGAELFPNPPRHNANNMAYADCHVIWPNEFTQKQVIFNPHQQAPAGHE
jgi:hypothetical protein